MPIKDKGAGRTRAGYLTVSVASAALVGILFLLNLNFLHTLESKLLDERFRLRGPRLPAVPVRIVAIDDASLEKLGRWPWPRTTLARLISILADAGVRVIGMDIILTEPERSPAQRVADDLLRRYQALGVARGGDPARRFEQELRDLGQSASPDQVLAAALARAPVVIAAYFSMEGARVAEKDPVTPQAKFGFLRLRNRGQGALLLPAATSLVEPLPILMASARRVGHVNIMPDSDGTVRRETLTIAYRQKYYPSLALQTARVALNIPDDQLLLDLQGTVGVGATRIPTDVEGRMLLNFAGPNKSFPHYSAADVLSGAVPPATFKDAIVFIGATATGIYDLRVTPYSAVFPGVEIHANTVENILGKTYLQRPPWVEVAAFVLILALPIGLGVVLGRLSPLHGGLLSLGLMVALFLFAHLLFVDSGVWFPVFYPLLGVVLTYGPVTAYRAVTEQRQRLFIKRAFQQYVPEGVVNQIAADPTLLRFGGERRVLTVLFSDIRDFTTYSERHDAEHVVEMLREYLTHMVEVVFQNGGTLDKFVGDAVMAVFGAPVSQPDHALRACRAAVEMMAELRRLTEKWQAEGKDPFRIGVGVNTGEVIVGNLGSDQRFDYTVIGDPVNLAARLEGLNKEFPGKSGIILSEYTLELVRDRVEAAPLGEVKVKGKAKPVAVFELQNVKPALPE